MTVRTLTAGTATRRYCLQGFHAELGDQFAAWAPHVQHVEPGVRSSRFAALLAPFATREAAEQALIAEGATILPPDHR